MRCNNRHEQITALAAGELTPIQAWWLRHHLRQCPACSGHLQQAQDLAAALAELGEAVPSDTLRDRVFAALQFLASRAEGETNRWHRQQAAHKRKIWYAFSGALAALTLTGGIVVQMQHLHRSAAFIDPSGQTWTLSGNFVGRAYIMNNEGRYIGIYRCEEGDLFTGPTRYAWPGEPDSLSPEDKEKSVSGMLEIYVAGEHFAVEGYGIHALRNFSGNLLGYAFLGWPGTQQRQIAHKLLILPKPILRHPATSALSAFPWGVCAVDKQLDITWQMPGPGKVQVLEPGQRHPMMTARTGTLTPELRKQSGPDLIAAATRKTPEFTWTVRGRSGHGGGYGAHPIVDDQGKTVVILKAGPLP